MIQISNQRARQRLLAATMLSSTMLSGIPLAHAEDNKGVVALDEVVVTAQKRSENLQNVPVSVQAIGQAKLEQLQISNFNDYVKYLPSVSFQTNGPGFSQVYMRGVASGGDGNHSGPLPSVGTYLDEQPITTIQGALDIHVYDLERVEALSGPQGTLYGASSQAGTIKLVTNKPSLAGFSAGYDLEGNQVAGGAAGHVFEGFVNVPLNDHAAIRLVGWDVHDAGYIDNVPTTRTYPTWGGTINNKATARKNYNPVDTQGGRAALKINLDDNWTITPIIMGQQQKAKGIFAYDPTKGDLKVGHFFPEGSKDRWMQAALTVQGNISNLDIVYNASNLKRIVETQSDYTDYSYFYDTMSGSGAYWTDDAGKPVNPSQYINGKDRYGKVSHELRISTPSKEKLRFVGGLFYQRQTHFIHQNYRIDALGSSISVPGKTGTIWLTEQERIDRDSAVFGELSYDINENWSATIGARVFKAQNSLVGFYGYGKGFSSKTGEAACFAPAKVAGSPCTNLDKETKDSGTIPKVTVTYKLDPKKLVYLTYSKGFRPGGINRRSTLPPYSSDFLKNYEFGWKTSWAENRVRWNGAVYMEEWEGFQFALLGANGLTEIKNAGAAEIKGIESDLTWLIARGLTMNGSAAYTDAALSKNYCGFVDKNGKPETNCAKPEAPTGTALPVTPQFKANLALRYEFNIGDYEAFVQGAAVNQTSSWTDLRLVERSIIGRQKGYSTFDLSAGISHGNWSLSAYVKNATDERASLNRYAECAEKVCGSQIYIVPNQPRTIGIKFGQTF